MDFALVPQGVEERRAPYSDRVREGQALDAIPGQVLEEGQLVVDQAEYLVCHENVANLEGEHRTPYVCALGQ